MSSATGDVTVRAGALMRAWRRRDVAALNGELCRVGLPVPKRTESGFEAERAELLDCIAFQMFGAAQSTGDDCSVGAAEIDVCMGLLKHLATRPPSSIC